MKGVIFQSLEGLVLTHRDMACWNQLLAKNAPKDRAYVSVNNYPDQELNALVSDICIELQLSRAKMLNQFGHYLFNYFMKHYSVVVGHYSHFEALILNIDSVIHKEVHKLYRNSNLPVLDCMMVSAGHIVMHYRSPRQLCFLAEGLIYGAGEYFLMDVRIEHDQCLLRNDECCTLNIYFQPSK